MTTASAPRSRRRTQIPVEQVPDPHLDRRLAAGDDPEEINRDTWVRLERWLAGRGLQLVFHEEVPVARERWIGVCLGVQVLRERFPGVAPDALRELTQGLFDDHCLVMSFDQIIFDPMARLKQPPGQRARTWRPSDVAYGISFDRIEPKEE